MTKRSVKPVSTAVVATGTILFIGGTLAWSITRTCDCGYASFDVRIGDQFIGSRPTESEARSLRESYTLDAVRRAA